MTYSNHYLYLLLLLLQQVLLFSLHWAILNNHWPLLESFCGLFPVEISVRMALGDDFCLVPVYLYLLAALFYNSLFLSMELYGLCILQVLIHSYA